MINETKRFGRGGFIQTIAVYITTQAGQGFQYGYLTQNEKEFLQNWASRVYQVARL